MKYKLNELLYDRATGLTGVINKVYDNDTYQLDTIGKTGELFVMEKPVTESYINYHYKPVERVS